MLNIPLREVIILLVVLAVSIFFFFFWMRRRRQEKNKKQLEKLKENLEKSKNLEVKEVSEKDKNILDNLVQKIEKTATKNEERADIKLEEGYHLRMETSDIIALVTPNYTLHKSFSEVRFKEIRKTDNGYEILLKS